MAYNFRCLAHCSNENLVKRPTDYIQPGLRFKKPHPADIAESAPAALGMAQD